MKGAVFLILLTSLALGENAGIKTRITQNALDFFTDAKQILPMLPEMPEFADSTEIAVLGKIDYKVYDIKITSLKHSPKTFLTVKPGVGLYWHGGEIRVAVEAKWIYDTHSIIPISDSGKVEVKITVKSTPFDLKVAADESGHLKIDIADNHCHYHVEESDIELSGGKEWLYNLFEDKIEEMLKKVANEQICDLSSDAIRKDLASALSTVEVIIPLIPDVMSLDLSLTANPASTESFLDILHSGEIFDVSSRSNPSQDKPAFPSDSEDSHMFYIWLTDYGLNSAGQALFSSGYLHYSLTQKEIPENSTLQLNTSGYEISLLLPQISKSYPNKEIQFNIYPSSPPSVQLTEEAVELQVQINIELHIIQDESTTDNVATLQTTLQLAGSLGLEDSRLIWSVSSFSSQSKLLEADVKDLDMDIINSALSFASHAFIKQYIKDKGSEGIPLPELDNGWEIVHPSIEQGEGFVKIGIDLAR